MPLVGSVIAGSCPATGWPEKGSYPFTNWPGPALRVFYVVPTQAGADTPVLFVIPGAKRNAEEYRDAWHELAVANRFITLTLEAKAADFPTEYDYNAGGVLAADGTPVAERRWLYSAIEPVFDDFRHRFNSQRMTYSIYGHSAGGQFVHTYLLFKPQARVERAVAANPAFCLVPGSTEPYPFGFGGVPASDEQVKHWLASPLVLLLGDRDRSPLDQPLSSGPLAQAQGPHVYARGLKLFQSALVESHRRGVELAWKLEVVPQVGHSNHHMAASAVKHLFPP